MSMFSNLGDQLGVPLIQQTLSTATTAAGDVASRITNFATQQFGVASPTALTQEMVAKIASSDLTKNFSYVSSSASAASSAAGLVQQQITGTPASLLPKNSSSSAGSTNALKVILTQTPKVLGQLNSVTFEVMPRISESGGADYESVQPAHHPGAIQKYRTSTPREWSISAKLIARNVDEATKMLNIMNMIRSWRMPFYGQGTANNENTAQYLGAPPPILTLTAYGNGAIGPVKCVMTHYNWDWPDDIDYIHTSNGNPMPVMMDISLSLVETWSPAEFSGFDLAKYRAGKLGSGGAFQSTALLPNSDTSSTSTVVTSSSDMTSRSESTTISSSSASALSSTISTASTGAQTISTATSTATSTVSSSLVNASTGVLA